MSIPNILIQTNIQRVAPLVGAKSIAYVSIKDNTFSSKANDIKFLKDIMGFDVKEVELANTLIGDTTEETTRNIISLIDYDEVDMIVVGTEIKADLAKIDKELINNLINSVKNIEIFFQSPKYIFSEASTDVQAPFTFLNTPATIPNPDYVEGAPATIPNPEHDPEDPDSPATIPNPAYPETIDNPNYVINVIPKELYRVSISYGYAGVLGDEAKLVSAAAISAAITKQHKLQGVPHEAVAGIGVAPNILSQLVIPAADRLKKVEKETLQTAGYNVLHNKRNHGTIFVSQYSLLGKVSDFTGYDEKDPRHKKGASTLHLYIIENLYNIGERAYHKPNNRKTWDLIELAVKKELDKHVSNLAIKPDYRVLVGLGKTMIEADLDAGNVKVDIAYTPVGYVEAITFTININLNEGTIVA